MGRNLTVKDCAEDTASPGVRDVRFGNRSVIDLAELAEFMLHPRRTSRRSEEFAAFPWNQAPPHLHPTPFPSRGGVLSRLGCGVSGSHLQISAEQKERRDALSPIHPAVSLITAGRDHDTQNKAPTSYPLMPPQVPSQAVRV
ncbi:hypothetical protein chiPu_0010587 [Chiloscyllium punctatum]|uniref:Uncharacterized protein n=1 Tax=Chiloscyllium punctatum TaxID=137246 RepID=A0A401SP12_CHIPU|nr:hypothetical protein [Chiloscyllium punctatum]